MYTIGEFARFGGISVRMLRHYDEVGLLRPARVDAATGYRRYSAHQLARLNRLVALRALGFGLTDIERLLDTVHAHELRGMFELRRSQLSADIEHQTEQLAAVERRLRLIESEEHPPMLDVITKSLPAERVIAVPGSAPGLGPVNLQAAVAAGFGTLRSIIRANKIKVDGPAFCFYEEIDEGQRVYCALGVDPSIESVPDPAALLYLPPVELAVTAVWQGSMASYLPYPELARWIEDHDLSPVGAGRDRFIQLETSDSPAVVEIHWPVRRPGGPQPDVAARRID